MVVLVRSRTEPATLHLRLDDPVAARVFTGSRSPWLRRPADVLFREMARGDIDIIVEHIDLADGIAAPPLGCG